MDQQDQGNTTDREGLRIHGNAVKYLTIGASGGSNTSGNSGISGGSNTSGNSGTSGGGSSGSSGSSSGGGGMSLAEQMEQYLAKQARTERRRDELFIEQVRKLTEI
jgi:hypothetical protein